MEDALREVGKLGLLVRINCKAPNTGPIRFDSLAELYLKTDYGEDAGRPKSVNSIPSWSIRSGITSLPAGALRLRRTSRQLTFKDG